MWCRACGEIQPADHRGNCACGADLASDPFPASPIGLVFEGRGTFGLRKRYGVCVGFDAESLLVHFAAKEKELTRLPVGTSADPLVSASLGPASRIVQALALAPKGSSWDEEMLRRRVGELCGSTRMVRQLFDDALEQGWQHILDWAPLTASEKAWRVAHHASSRGDLARLRDALLALPETGYAGRVDLLLAHLAEIRKDAQTWQPVLQRMVGNGVDRSLALLVSSIGKPDKALESALGFLPAVFQAGWNEWLEQLGSGQAVSGPPTSEAPAWLAVSLVSDETKPNLDARLGDIAGLSLPLLDDLIDAGRVTAGAPLAGLAGERRNYLLARVDPDKLTTDELSSAGHLSELARRLYLARDRALLSGLEGTTRVRHYQALLEVLEGGRADPERLDEATVARLRQPEQVAGLLKDGGLRTLPNEIVEDPSLWMLFADQATSGTLLPDVGRPAGHPVNTWIGLRRLLGLVWEGKFAEAVEHGRQLLPALTDERSADEAANLTAFALDQLGRSDEALIALEDALRGEYSENLLINVSIVASRVRPEVGIRHLSRLVDEARTPELRRSSLMHSIEVWRGSDLEFPQVLIPHLQTMMAKPDSFDDYLHLARVAAVAVPGVMNALPDPGGSYSGPYRTLRAAARFKVEQSYAHSDLATDLIGVYRSVGQPEWWLEEWKGWVSAIEDALFVDFGEALGPAQFVDTVISSAPELLTTREFIVMAPQAGAHTAVFLAGRKGWLNEKAWAKYFFKPAEQFFAHRSEFEPDHAEFLAGNMTLCIGNAAFRMLGFARDDFANEFNEVIDRLRWDADNRLRLLMRREELLRELDTGSLAQLERVVQLMRRLGSRKREDLTRDIATDVEDWRREIDKLKRD